MARIKSSGLIQGISGKVGDIVFVRHKGTLTVQGVQDLPMHALILRLRCGIVLFFYLEVFLI